MILGVAATPLFALTGIYATMFHNAWTNCAHLAFAVGITTAAVALAGVDQGTQDMAVAASKGIITLSIVIVLPFIHIAYTLLRGTADESMTDGLTGLLNRNGLERALSRTTTGDAERSTTWSVTLIDLDSFKRINDTAGHLAGDQVLGDVARAIRHIAAADHLVARFGGDEFLIIARNPAFPDAVVAEHIRAAINDRTGGVVTASIGVTRRTGVRLDLPGAVIVADRAMYEAKHEGGDRVVVAPPRGPDADQGSNL